MLLVCSFIQKNPLQLLLLRRRGMTTMMNTEWVSGLFIFNAVIQILSERRLGSSYTGSIVMTTTFQITKYFFILHSPVPLVNHRLLPYREMELLHALVMSFLFCCSQERRWSGRKVDGERTRKSQERKRKTRERYIKGSRCGFLFSNIFLHSHVTTCQSRNASHLFPKAKAHILLCKKE